MKHHTITRSAAHFIDKNGLRKNVLFESYEHMFIGNQITLWSADGVLKPAADMPLALPNGLQLTYGRIVALAGDFFGLPGEAIADDPAPPSRFVRAFGQLAQDSKGSGEVAAINAVMQEEIDAVRSAISRGQTDLYKVYEGLHLDGRYNRATGGGSMVTDYLPLGRYLALAKSNFDHFGDDAVKAYSIGHGQALQQALRARTLSGPQREAALQLAFAMNAFADHFLSDLFSAGHLRTPRRALDVLGKQSAAPSSLLLSGLCAKAMHDEDSYHGLWVRNARGQKWRAFGDKKLFDHQDEDNKRQAIAAVQESAREVWQAFSTGEAPQAMIALELVPDLQAVRNRSDDHNHSPLFTAQASGEVLRRNRVGVLSDYSWTGDWWFATTWHLLESTLQERLSGITDSPLGIDPIVVQFFGNPDGRMGMIQYGPSQNGYETLWSSFDMGQGSGHLALLKLDLDGDQTTEFLQTWQAGPDVGAIVYALDARSGGYQCSFATASALPGATGGRWLACRRKHGGAWIARCTDPDNTLGIDVLRATPDRPGLEVLWRLPQVFDRNHRGNLLAADIDGDGNDELVWAGSTLGLSFSFGAIRLGEDGPQVIVRPREASLNPAPPCLALDIDGSGRQSLVCIGETQDGSSGFTRAFQLDGSGTGFKALPRQEHTFSGRLIGWLVVDADQDGGADLVRVGALNGRTTIQLLRSRKDGSFDAGHANAFDVLPTSVGLLTSRVGGKGRYVVHHLFDNHGKLGWAVFTPNAQGTGFGLAGRQDDMKQGPGAIGFFTADSTVLTAD
jgi:hypothetical protein